MAYTDMYVCVCVSVCIDRWPIHACMYVCARVGIDRRRIGLRITCLNRYDNSWPIQICMYVCARVSVDRCHIQIRMRVHVHV